MTSDSAVKLRAIPRPRQGISVWADVLLAERAHAFAMGEVRGLAAISARGAGAAKRLNGNQNVYMTRVNASGDGASGPHPEREPA